MSEDNSVQTTQTTAVVTVPYTMQVPKEGKELIDAQNVLTAHFVNGGDLQGAAVYLPALMKGAQGASKIGAEMRSEYNDEMVGYAVHKLWDSLKKK